MLVPLSGWTNLFGGSDVRGWHRLLRARGFDLEPDPASGGAAPSDAIVLFRLPAAEAETYLPTPDMWTSLILMRLGLTVARDLGQS